MSNEIKSKQAKDKMIKARSALIINNPFFGNLALRLKIIEDLGCNTMWTDGVSIGYDPTFVNDHSNEQVRAVIAHEVLHCALQHTTRRGNRNAETWNKACDYAVNPILRDSGFDLPSCALIDNRFKDKAAEAIYSTLYRENPKQDNGNSSQQKGKQGDDNNGNCQSRGNENGTDDSNCNGNSGTSNSGDGKGKQKGKKGKGNGKGQSQGQGQADESQDSDGQGQSKAGQSYGGMGEVRDCPKGTDKGELEQSWRIALTQAKNIAKSQGRCPGSLERLVKELNAPMIDWRSELRRFMSETAKDDYSWSRPNRRFIGQGIYLPSLYSEKVGEIVVAVDTSGSINEMEFKAFLSEVRFICEEIKPEKVIYLNCDTRITQAVEVEIDQIDSLTCLGGGGTRFSPVFRWIEDNGIMPKCLLYFTDMECSDYPDCPPDYPVMWVTAANLDSHYIKQYCTFGEVLPLVLTD